MLNRKPFDILVLGAGVLIGLSALGVLGVAFFSGTPVPWFMVGFEGVLLAGAVFCWLIGRRRFAEGHALALVCVSGAIFTATLFGYLSAGKQLVGQSLLPLAIARFGLGGLLMIIAGWDVLTRQPGPSFRLFGRGLVLLAPFVVATGVLYAGQGWIRALAVPGPLKAVVLMIVGVVLLGLLAGATHQIIRAFEQGRSKA